MTSSNYKWILGGAGLGWLLGGPIGAMLGVIIGSQINTAKNASGRRRIPGDHYNTEEKEVIISFLILCAEITKADGFIAAEEIRLVKEFLIRNFGDKKAALLMQLYKKILEQAYDINAICRQIDREMDPVFKQTVVQVLFEIARADGEIKSVEGEKIHELAGKIGVGEADFLSIRSMYAVKTNKEYYAILEAPETASDQEVKDAYRTMVKKYHPDKVGHLGEEFKKLAEEKFKQIQAAYERIKKERKI
jgi:DnaJ like chaperone protein